MGLRDPAKRHLPDKMGPRDPREAVCPTKRGLATRGKPFARQNGASRCAGRHLPDKMRPRASQGGICPTKRGLALRGKTFARQNGASRCAGRHLPDKTGPRASRGGICPTKWGLATPRNAKPRLISYISRLGSPDCPPRRASRRFPSMGHGACRRLAPRRDRGLPNG